MNGTSRHCKGLLIASLLLLSLVARAHIGGEYQMQLGDPSDAKTDPSNHDHYLIQRNVLAEDYDDDRGEPNWVSWDLTAEDIGPAKRTPTFHADPGLPQTFHHIKSADYKSSGFDRGHMCPSADRTDSQEDNAEVFAMSNIIPQSKDNNEGVWEHLEAYCRELAEQGNELLIICGPGKFNGQHLSGPDPVEIPGETWKIVVEVPNGPGTALNRISAATRVIAVDIPNVEGVRNDPWQKYLVSVNQLEAETGFKFFTALSPDLAAYLKMKVDGQPTPAFAASRATTTSTDTTIEQINWVPIALDIGIFVLIVSILICVMIFRLSRKK